MSLLKEYYDSIAEENRSKTAANFAQADLTGAQQNQIYDNAAQTRALQAAQTDATLRQGMLSSAQAGNIGTQGRLIGAQADEASARAMALPGTAAAETNLNNANAAQTRQNIQIRGFDLPGSNLGTLGLGMGGGLPGFDPTKVQGYEKGGKVKGKRPDDAVQGKGKPGPHDTVPVMMAPGEAVLNKGAVEHYGSDVVDKMNAMGLKRMGAQSEVAGHLGMPDPHAAPKSAADGKDKGKGGEGGGKSKKPASKAPTKADLPSAA